jgi:hypothetical protein
VCTHSLDTRCATKCGGAPRTTQASKHKHVQMEEGVGLGGRDLLEEEEGGGGRSEWGRERRNTKRGDGRTGVDASPPCHLPIMLMPLVALELLPPKRASFSMMVTWAPLLAAVMAAVRPAAAVGEGSNDETRRKNKKARERGVMQG